MKDGEITEQKIRFDFIVRCYFDQERIPLEEVFEQLRTSRRGLSSDDAEARIEIFGPNKLEEKKVSTYFL